MIPQKKSPDYYQPEEIDHILDALDGAPLKWRAIVYLMIANGINIVTAANELGHSTPSTTANIYAHQIAETKAKANEVCSSAFTHRRKTAEHKKSC